MSNFKSPGFREKELLRKACKFTQSLDIGAPNLFNNKVMLRDTVSRAQ